MLYTLNCNEYTKNGNPRVRKTLTNGKIDYDSTWTWRCLRTRRFAPCSLGISPLKEPAIETGHHQRVPIIIAAVLVIVNVVLSILFIFTEKSISPEFYYVGWITIIILL